VASLYTQPTSLANGALAGIATASTAAWITREPLIVWCAATLVTVAICRVAAAYWLTRNGDAGQRDEHVREAVFGGGAWPFAL